jgi:hypothetical protein
MTTNVKITFSELMDPTTVDGGNAQLDNLLQLIPATINKDPTDTSGRTYVLDPYSSEAGHLDPNDPTGRTWVVDPSLLRTNSEVEVEIGPDAKDLSDDLSMSSYSHTYFKTASW